MKATRARKGCSCLLCQPVPGKRAHPLYGFDLDAVPAIDCLDCLKPIGSEEYVEETALARFGIMQFLHKRCAEALGYKPLVPKYVRSRTRA